MDYEGEVVRFGGGRLNFPARPDIPIVVATRGNLVLRMAGEHADGVMIATYATPIGVKHALAQVDQGLARAGRTRADVSINSRVDAWVDRDPRVAQAALRPMIAGFLATSYPDKNFVHVVGQEISPALDAVLAKKDRDHSWANAHLVSDELLAQFCWAGTAGAGRRADRRGGAPGDHRRHGSPAPAARRRAVRRRRGHPQLRRGRAADGRGGDVVTSTEY